MPAQPMPAENNPSFRLNQSVVAAILYGLGLLGCAVIGLCAAFGGWSTTVLGIPLSIGHATALRVPIASLILGYLVDPQRSVHLAWLDGQFARRSRAITAATVGLLAIGLATFKCRQHLALQTTAYDQSMFEYALYNTIHGRFLHAYGIETNFLGHHFSPALLVLVLPYALWPSAYVLLIAQAVALSAAAIPLFAFCRAWGVKPFVSWLVTLGLFTNTIVWRAFVFDFHVELLAPPLFFALAWALAIQRWGWAAVFLVATLAVKEDLGLLTSAVALYLLATRRPKAWLPFGLVALISILFVVVALKVLIPLGRPDGPASDFLGRYQSLGSSLVEVVLSSLTKPGVLLSRVFAAPMRGVMNSMAWLPLLNPLSLAAAAPSFLLHLLSDYAPQRSLDVYYGLWGVLMLWCGLPRTLLWLGQNTGLIAALALIGFKPGFAFMPEVTADDHQVRAVFASFGANERLALPTIGVPQVVPGEVRRIFPQVDGADTLVLTPCRARWPLADEAYWPAVEHTLSSGEWGLSRSFKGGVVLKRGGAVNSTSALAELKKRCP